MLGHWVSRLSVVPLIAIAAMTAGGRASAQDGAAAPGTPLPSAQADRKAPEIVVTAPTLADERKMRAMARSITPNISFYEPLARFTEPVCFATAGLARPLLIEFSNRLVRNAQQAAIRLAKNDCRPNVVVLFVDDGKAEVGALAKRRPWLFRNLEPSAIDRLVHEPGPVHVWTSTEILSLDGEGTHQVADLPFNNAMNVRTASIITLPTRRDILFSVIMIDRKAAVGRSLTQIADYAGMRTLAMVRPKGTSGGDTILTLFDPEPANPPDEMTRFDRGYLKALYAGGGNQRSTMKVSLIARGIVRDARARAAQADTVTAPEQASE